MNKKAIKASIVLVVTIFFSLYQAVLANESSFIGSLLTIGQADLKDKGPDEIVITNSRGVPLTEEELTYYELIKNVPIYSPNAFVPKDYEVESEIENVIIKERETLFENNDHYSFKRINFKTASSSTYETSFTIPGNDITIQYVDPETKKWVKTKSIAKLPKNTLFIDTDMYHIVLSVPGVYQLNSEYITADVKSELETPVKISRTSNGYQFSLSFPQDPSLTCEYWLMQSEKTLIDWTDPDILENLKTHDLGIDRRWLYDGYYFKTPSTYYPHSENTLYRHPANYTGKAWSSYRFSSNFLKNMGYLMTLTCMQNQTKEGYWATGPKSDWLFRDFNIANNFYDTRFNSDFSIGLVYAYQKYNNKDFLISALKYADYFLDYAKNNHYAVEKGGWLVEDYDSRDINTKRTHISLNHQLAEINFLLEIYNVTGIQKYFNTANLMLTGIENTVDEWILPDSNLKYALMYTGSDNLVDYPYLTYNDLFTTNQILNKLFKRSNETVTKLMNAKKSWMDKNNVTEYMK